MFPEICDEDEQILSGFSLSKSIFHFSFLFLLLIFFPHSPHLITNKKKKFFSKGGGRRLEMYKKILKYASGLEL